MFNGYYADDFNPSGDNSLNLVCLSWAMFRKNFEREKDAKFFSSKNQIILSKLNSKDFAEELIVRKVSELMHRWFTLKGEVKNIRCCPMNQLQLSDVQWVLCR